MSEKTEILEMLKECTKLVFQEKKSPLAIQALHRSLEKFIHGTEDEQLFDLLSTEINHAQGLTKDEKEYLHKHGFQFVGEVPQLRHVRTIAPKFDRILNKLEEAGLPLDTDVLKTAWLPPYIGDEETLRLLNISAEHIERREFNRERLIERNICYAAQWIGYYKMNKTLANWSMCQKLLDPLGLHIGMYIINWSPPTGV